MLIFVILETRLWYLFMLVFLAEMCWAILTFSGIAALERTASYWRIVFFAVTDSTLLVFWLLQTRMILRVFRGMQFSIHLVLIKSIFDLISSFFVWSHYQKYLQRPKHN